MVDHDGSIPNRPSRQSFPQLNLAPDRGIGYSSCRSHEVATIRPVQERHGKRIGCDYSSDRLDDHLSQGLY